LLLILQSKETGIIGGEIIKFFYESCGEITDKGLVSFGKALNPSVIKSLKLIFLA